MYSSVANGTEMDVSSVLFPRQTRQTANSRDRDGHRHPQALPRPPTTVRTESEHTVIVLPKVHCHLQTPDTNPSSPLCIACVPPTPEQGPSIQSPGNELRHVHESISRSSALPLPPAPPPIQTVRPIQLQRIRDAENERWLSGQHDSDRCGEGT